MSEFLHPFKCGHTLKCEHIKPDASKTQSFTVVYAHGFCSDPYGRKPEEIKKWCIENGIGFFRTVLAGHGDDKANFEKTTLNTYKTQIFEVIENIVEGPVVMAGSSLGGWLSLLTALQYPERVIGILGLAAAPDFLKTYFENYFKPEHLDILNKYGKIEFPTGDFTYVITKEMIESGNENLLLDKEIIPYNGKVRLLQGMKDASLRWKTALTIAEKLSSDDVSVRLMKNSNHRLGSDEDIAAIKEFLSEF